MSKWGLTNTYWAVLLPSIVSPFGDQKLFPITVGLQTWNVTTEGANKFLYTLIVTGALVSSLIIARILLEWHHLFHGSGCSTRSMGYLNGIAAHNALPAIGLTCQGPLPD